MPLARSRLLPKLPWKAMYFDGQDDYVETSNVIRGRDKVSVEVFVYAESFDGIDRTVLGQWNSPETFLIWYDVGDNKWEVIINDSAGNVLKAVPDIYAKEKEWVHLLCTYDKDNELLLYINAELRAHTKSLGNPINMGKEYLGIGFDYSIHNYFHGYIAFVRVYDRALTDSEIEWNYYHPDDPVRSGLVLWLHYDSIDEENNIWRDKTANGNNGTIYGATPAEFTKPPIRKLTPSRTLSPER